MSRGVLFIGGRGPGADFISRFLRAGDVICAADSGLDAALEAGIRPHGIVGDMDSISDPQILDDFPEKCIWRYPRDKNETDTELGILWLRNRGCSPLILIGGGEGRLDHTVALLNLFSREDYPDFWYTGEEEIRSLGENTAIHGKPGDPVSIAAVGRGPWRLESDGLEWPLETVSWASGGMSLSNRFSGTEARLSVHRGRFLCMRPLEVL